MRYRLHSRTSTRHLHAWTPTKCKRLNKDLDFTAHNNLNLLPTNQSYHASFKTTANTTLRPVSTSMATVTSPPPHPEQHSVMHAWSLAIHASWCTKYPRESLGSNVYAKGGRNVLLQQHSAERKNSSNFLATHIRLLLCALPDTVIGTGGLRLSKPLGSSGMVVTLSMQ